MRIILLFFCLQNIAFATDGLNLKQELSQNYYFIFIFKSSCPHCHKFAPVIYDFAKTFNVNIKAYSVDGGALDGIYGKPLTADLFKTFYLSDGYKPTVPALFLVNKDTLQVYAVLFGEASPYQLARRINELLQHIQERFNAQ